ncbi:MAG: SpoIIE family protein phosphatase [Deltaproteobacteria bacterium]|nr:SpoIIE family protein phosphatase [Deltaproteobacteria bacterium]
MSLRAKLLFLFTILSIIPLGIAGRNMTQITRDELKSAANDHLMSVAGQVTQVVEDFYRYSWMNPLLFIQKAVENESLAVNEKLSLLTEGMKNAPDLVAIQISVEGVDSPLLVIQDEFSALLKQSSLNAEHVLRLDPHEIAGHRNQQEAFVGGLTYLEQVDRWLLTIVIPLAETTFGRTATLAARVNLERLAARIKEHSFNKTGFITLIDAEGHKIFDSNRTDLSQCSLVKTIKELLSSDTRTIGVVPYVSPSGERMLGAYALPTNLDVGIIVEKSEAFAYMAVTQMVKNLILWVTVGFIVAIVGAIVVSVSLTRPLRKLTQAARIISEGDLSINIETPKSKDEIGELSLAFEMMLEDLRSYIARLTETTKAKERAESELKLAHDIQQSFLPRNFPDWEQIDIWGKCDPAREVGGDYFDLFQIDDDHYGMVIGDVSGKGVPAALFMAVSRTLFRILSSRELSPDLVLTEFNNKLVELDQGSNMFITLFYAVFNDKTHRLIYSSAGHNMPYVKGSRLSEGTFLMLPGMKTMVAGIMDGITMPVAETFLRRSGDTIVLYTDGMIEADNEEGEIFGEERLETLLNHYTDLPAKELCEMLIKEVKEFQAGRPQFDDMTVLTLKVK